MALPDISELTVTELEALIKACSSQIDKRRKAKKAELAKQFRQLAKSEGLEIDEILEAPAPKKPGKKRGPKPGAKKKARRKVAPKYRNPDNSAETWTGRGRKPLWVANALESGKTLDDLLIQD